MLVNDTFKHLMLVFQLIFKLVIFTFFKLLLGRFSNNLIRLKYRPEVTHARVDEKFW